MIKNAKFSGYYFYVKLNIWRDFQISISVPLSKWIHFQNVLYSWEMEQITDMLYVIEISEKFLRMYVDVYVVMLLYLECR